MRRADEGRVGGLTLIEFFGFLWRCNGLDWLAAGDLRIDFHARKGLAHVERVAAAYHLEHRHPFLVFFEGADVHQYGLRLAVLGNDDWLAFTRDSVEQIRCMSFDIADGFDLGRIAHKTSVTIIVISLYTVLRQVAIGTV